MHSHTDCICLAFLHCVYSHMAFVRRFVIILDALVEHLALARFFHSQSSFCIVMVFAQIIIFNIFIYYYKEYMKVEWKGLYA